MMPVGLTAQHIFKEPAEPTWYYKPWFLREDKIVILTGDGGSGKTFFLSQLAFCLALNRSFIGVPCSHQARVIYFDLEMGPTMLARRMRLVAVGLGLSEADMADIPLGFVCDGMNGISRGWHLGPRAKNEPEYMGELMNLCDEYEPDVLIIEPFINVCGPGIDMNQAGPVNHVIRELRAFHKMTVFIGHHETKGKLDAAGHKKPVQYRSLGTQALHSASDRHMSLTDLGTANGARIRTIEWGKSRNWEFPESFQYATTLDEESGLILMRRC